MNKLTKRSGELEEFSEAKLRASLTNAGASEDNARKVSEIVARNAREGMESGDPKTSSKRTCQMGQYRRTKIRSSHKTLKI